jgi:antitoxin component of RelBE/YafQ-DinJ toxin-antitoxin module
MRNKGKYRKEKKILIRVDRNEKEMAEEISHSEGKNTSEFFRGMLNEYSGIKQLDLMLKLTDNNRKLVKELKDVLAMAKRKGRG